MRQFFQIFALAMAFSLASAPFGMARMMGMHETGVSAHQHHQQHAPQKSTPHMRFMICAACIGVAAPSAALREILAPAEPLAFAELSARDGVNAVPLLPPPRS
jgi:hypothetical protein